MTRNRIIIVTGLSGSGKTVALDVFEDLGFFCIDNLPVALLDKLIELGGQPGREINRLALAMDARAENVAESLPPTIARLKEEGTFIEVLFLEARPEILVRRYSVSRRPHPTASPGMNLTEAIDSERRLLSRLREKADLIIDTSELSVHQLREEVENNFGSEQSNFSRMRVEVTSFGFSRGLPHNADLVFDVRFLPNPYFVHELKALPGFDSRVADYIAEREPTASFLDRLEKMLLFLLPQYQNEGKSFLTIALGCTGGQHRSVFVAEQIGQALNGTGYKVKISHRDVKVPTAP
jgi:RNase adapter protein RapZ